MKITAGAIRFEKEKRKSKSGFHDSFLFFKLYIGTDSEILFPIIVVIKGLRPLIMVDLFLFLLFSRV